jgi:hypothetical protein
MKPAPTLPKAPPRLGVWKGFPVPNVSIDCPLEGAVIVPAPKKTSAPACALANVALVQRAKISGKKLPLILKTTSPLVSASAAIVHFVLAGNDLLHPGTPEWSSCCTAYVIYDVCLRTRFQLAASLSNNSGADNEFCLMRGGYATIRRPARSLYKIGIQERTFNYRFLAKSDHHYSQ